MEIDFNEKLATAANKKQCQNQDDATKISLQLNYLQRLKGNTKKYHP